MPIDSEIIQHIYKSRLNLLKQMKNAGYNIDAFEQFSINDINVMHKNNQLDMIFTNPLQSVYCYHLLLKSLRTPYIEEIIEELVNIRSILKSSDIIILISQNNENDTIKLYLRKLFSDRHIYIVHRTLEQTQFNILEHDIVPKHTILNDNQTKEMFSRYNIISADTLPEISRFDPVVKALLVKPGQIVHIERPSKTSISGDYYRVCINK
jgi:DNA-directed RNA polymerase subunit H